MDAFQIKLAEFVERYHYPVDEDEHVNAPIENQSGGQAVGYGLLGAAAGSAVGLLGGIAASMPESGMPKAIGIGALAGGLTLGAYNAYKANNRYKTEIADPDAMYAKRREYFKKEILPCLQDDEDDYIESIAANANRYSNQGVLSALNGGVAAAHAYNSVNKDENGKITIDPYAASMVLSTAHESYQHAQKTKQHKEELDRRMLLSPAEELARDQRIRESYRSMKPSTRKYEYSRVADFNNPSRFAKSAGLLSKLKTTAKVTAGLGVAGSVAFTADKINDGLNTMKEARLAKCASYAVEVLYKYAGVTTATTTPTTPTPPTQPPSVSTMPTPAVPSTAAIKPTIGKINTFSQRSFPTMNTQGS